MALPILHSKHEPSREDLLRMFQLTEHRWVESLADATALEVGVAYANTKLGRIYNANHIRDVALPEGVSAERAVEVVERHYAGQKTRCAFWVMNVSAGEARTRPMVEHLMARGYRAVSSDVMVLRHAGGVAEEVEGLMVIPARASFRHWRALAEESAGKWGTPELAEASMMHLDDPHFDALLVLKDGVAVAKAGVLAVGEVGRVEAVYVAEAFRGRGIGRMVMGRVMEICARSQFRQVMLSVYSDNGAAIGLYRGRGFERVGSFVEYHAPDIGFPTNLHESSRKQIGTEGTENTEGTERRI